jgi:uncharacterized protein YoxC
MTEELPRVNPNTASLEELRRLPGIGPSLAQRVLEARPFAGPDDLRRVPGLGEAAILRLTPHLDFTTPEPGEIPAEEPSAALAAEDASEEEQPGSPPASSPPSRPTVPPRPPYSRSETLWLVAGASVASFLLSMILTLALLAGINGTLNFGRHQAVRQLQSDLAAAQQTLDGAVGDLQSVSRRLEALEGLSGRMNTVEDQVTGLQGEVDRALASVQSMQTSLDSLQQEARALSQRVERFDTFLEGLTQLLGTLPPAPTPAP